MTCVARGTGVILENMEIYAPFLVGLERTSSH
jgi:hypothetical protein